MTLIRAILLYAAGAGLVAAWDRIIRWGLPDAFRWGAAALSAFWLWRVVTFLHQRAHGHCTCGYRKT